MALLSRRTDLPWLPPGAELTVHTGEVPADAGPATSAFVFARSDGRWLLTHVRSRGWDVPGGHIDPGETPVQAARRELVEEVGARAVGDLPSVGYAAISGSGPAPDGWRYPWPVSTQVFYFADVELDADAVLADDVDEAALHRPAEAAALVADRVWYPLWAHVVRNAVRRHRALLEDCVAGHRARSSSREVGLACGGSRRA